MAVDLSRWEHGFPKQIRTRAAATEPPQLKVDFQSGTGQHLAVIMAPNSSDRERKIVPA